MDATVLIIGAGTFGVSTAWHLSQHHRDPSQVTLLDRDASPPPRSAAADVNRVLAADYPSPLYAGLAREALSFWAEDPDLEWYFHKAGRLVLREDGHPGPGRGGGEEGVVVRGSRRGAGATAVPAGAEHVELAAVGRRWGVLDGTDTRGLGGAYLDPEAGWVDSATATWQFLETAVRRRVKREVGDVTELLVDRTSRRIKGARTRDGRTFLAETVVLAAGAWTSALLSPVEDALGIAEEDRIERQAQATAIISASYPVAGEELKRMAECKMPCIMYGQVGEVVPATRDNKTLRYTNLKTKIVNTIVTSSGKRISAPPEKRSQHDVPRRLKIEMEETLTKRLMPGFAKGRPKWRMCWDNHTPTEDLLLCGHPHIKSLFIITGGSFNGYKFMPNIGKYMVNVLEGESNGKEMDTAWGWKSRAEIEAARRGNMNSRELRDFDTGTTSRL